MALTWHSDIGCDLFMELKPTRLRLVRRARLPRATAAASPTHRKSRWSGRSARNGRLRGTMGSAASSADERQSQSSGETPDPADEAFDWQTLFRGKYSQKEDFVSDESVTERFEDKLDGLDQVDMLDKGSIMPGYRGFSKCPPAQTIILPACEPAQSADPGKTCLTRETSYIRCFGPGAGNHLYWDNASLRDWDNVQTRPGLQGDSASQDARSLLNGVTQDTSWVAHLQYQRKKKKGDLPDKVFVTRRSVLTELFEISHIRTIYHIFVAILIVFSLNTILYDVLEKGTFSLNFGMIQWAFGKFPKVMAMWVVMQGSTLLVVYPAFYYWSLYRSPVNARILDIVWICAVIIYQLCFLTIPVMYLVENNLPPASSIIIATEQTRLLMKSHAFIRENTARVMFKKKDDDEAETCPDFSKYLYFLFSPTLVYRDSYPRTLTISWRYVVTNFLQVLACLFYTYYIFERFCVPVFQNFNREHITPRGFILSVFGCMMPGTLVLFIGFFAILHSWLNAFAEMLRFGDRLFYKASLFPLLLLRLSHSGKQTLSLKYHILFHRGFKLCHRNTTSFVTEASDLSFSLGQTDLLAEARQTLSLKHDILFHRGKTDLVAETPHTFSQRLQTLSLKHHILFHRGKTNLVTETPHAFSQMQDRPGH
ncbi:O-acyltransferase [Plakobranchus ocellatus]|uniref:O-acyltransferase n=1 Tax=Plakobranchus ocellatus TaxID=259542 RepID=A0AAV4CW30_9GAST|nr:O-acyltransferase [Plakobranchus ocellatus]